MVWLYALVYNTASCRKPRKKGSSQHEEFPSQDPSGLFGELCGEKEVAMVWLYALVSHV